MRRGWLVAGIFVLAAFCGSCGGPKTETLSLLVWEGYADPSFCTRSKTRITAKSSRRTWARATSLSRNCAAAARATTM